MALSARNRLTGEVTSIETSGPTAEVTVETEGGETAAAIITTDSVDRLGLSEGETVDAVIKATDVMVRNN
jgi:molybdate transport system regulatory protein